jgi:PPM family protein phosphatase
MDTHLFLQEDMDAPRELRIGNGSACVFSRRSPNKETPNEDAAGIFELSDGSAVVAVADGVGGHRGADQASALMLETLAVELEQVERGVCDMRTAILNALEVANRAVVALGIGAGTTILIVELRERSMRTFHVGDSQALLTGPRGKLKLVTTAHSPIGYALEAGVLLEEEALRHEARHLLSNMIGLENMHIEVGSVMELAPRDTLVVASDGLFDNLRLDEIAQLARQGTAIEACATLIEACRTRMAEDGPLHPSKPDDLSVVLFRAQAPNGDAG